MTTTFNDPRHEQKRKTLRFVGKVLLICGGLLMVIGIGSFFMAFGSFGPPKYFWCAFLGMPMLFVGIVLTKFGYMGSVARYMAEEVAPVGKDTFNYMAEGTKDSVKTLATAVGEGLAAGASRPASEKGNSVRCLKCNSLNTSEARFCDQCGSSLQKTRSCPACQELNDPDAKYCDNCGKAF